MFQTASLVFHVSSLFCFPRTWPHRWQLVRTTVKEYFLSAQFYELDQNTKSNREKSTFKLRSVFLFDEFEKTLGEAEGLLSDEDIGCPSKSLQLVEADFSRPRPQIMWRLKQRPERSKGACEGQKEQGQFNLAAE